MHCLCTACTCHVEGAAPSGLNGCHDASDKVRLREAACSALRIASETVDPPIQACPAVVDWIHHVNMESPPLNCGVQVYRFEWSTQGDGALTFWMDGKLLFRPPGMQGVQMHTARTGATFIFHFRNKRWKG